MEHLNCSVQSYLLFAVFSIWRLRVYAKDVIYGYTLDEHYYRGRNAVDAISGCRRGLPACGSP